MVKEVRAQREVSGSNRVGRVAMKFTRKMSEMGGRWPVGASIEKKKFHFFGVKIPIFSGFFRFQLCRVSALGKDFAECRHSAKTLPSARQKALGKDAFADGLFAKCSLPSAALGKAFAECKLGFAECPWHSAKPLIPVVMRPRLWAKEGSCC